MNVDKTTRAALDAIEDAQSAVKWQVLYLIGAASLLVAFIVGATLQIVLASGDAKALSVFTIFFGVGGSGVGTCIAIDQLRASLATLRVARRRHRDLLLDQP